MNGTVPAMPEHLQMAAECFLGDMHIDETQDVSIQLRVVPNIDTFFWRLER
jgi:hypothetical protein